MSFGTGCASMATPRRRFICAAPNASRPPSRCAGCSGTIEPPCLACCLRIGSIMVSLAGGRGAMKSAAGAFGLAAALLWFVASPARAQVLDIATDQSPVGLDRQVATSFATQLITSTVYEGLTEIDAELHVAPALAQSWTVSDDGRSYLFQLRPGVEFHNGRALTPADVVASAARVRDPKTGSPYASRFTSVTNVEPEGGAAVR